MGRGHSAGAAADARRLKFAGPALARCSRPFWSVHPAKLRASGFCCLQLLARRAEGSSDNKLQLR